MDGKANKKIICICNTYYQLIFSMQLKRTIYMEDYFVVLFSNHSNNAKDVVNRFKDIGYFDEIYYIKTKNIDYSLERRFDFVKLMRYEIEQIHNSYYDELLYYNCSVSTIALYNILYKNNSNLKASRFEEGILSYDSKFYKDVNITGYGRVNKLLYYFRKMIPSLNLYDRTERYLCYYPELYGGTFKGIKVPLISMDDDLKKTIDNVFKTEKNSCKYKEKYIFFTSVYDFEGGEAIGEYKLVCDIANIVGKDNLLVKMHPRDSRNIYINNGFRVDINSSIPFEALLFKYDFSDKILLTATSGAVLAAGLMMKRAPQIFYMYPCCNISENQSAQLTVKQINKVLLSDCLKKKIRSISICEDINIIKGENKQIEEKK